MKSFDLKFGNDFLGTVPITPGIYKIYDEKGKLIYVGKAKNLRRRLGQYKNAKRRKKHRKMRKIIEFAEKIQFQECETELDAELLEAEIIQTFRPKWNVAGAFYFLYPMIGMKFAKEGLFFCYTTQPELFQDFSFHGAFRSREIVGEAFFSLMKLLKYVGHPIAPKKSDFKKIPSYSYVYGFRQLPTEWMNLGEEFWKGSSKALLELLVFSLIENAGARKNSHEIQEHLNHIKRFWDHEAKPLLRARKQVNYTVYPVSQKERDLVFLKFRHARKFLQQAP